MNENNAFAIGLFVAQLMTWFLLWLSANTFYETAEGFAAFKKIRADYDAREFDSAGADCTGYPIGGGGAD